MVLNPSIYLNLKCLQKLLRKNSYHTGEPSLRFQTPTACAVELSVAVELDNIPVCVD